MSLNRVAEPGKLYHMTFENGCDTVFSTMSRKFLLFDFDGVFTDTFHEAYSITKLLRPSLTHEGFRDLFMGNIYEEMASQDKVETPEVVRHSEDEFFVKYFELTKNLGFISGMRDAVLALSETHHLSVISSASSVIIKEMFERENVAHYFTDILGSDTETNKTKKIQMVFDKYGASAENSLFITDTVGDIREARKLNVDSIAVTWGYHGAERLWTAKPAALVNTPTELLQIIQNR